MCKPSSVMSKCVRRFSQTLHESIFCCWVCCHWANTFYGSLLILHGAWDYKGWHTENKIPFCKRNTHCLRVKIRPVLLSSAWLLSCLAALSVTEQFHSFESRANFTDIFFFIMIQNSLEISVWNHPTNPNSNMIATWLCTWHDSFAVMACAKFCCNLMTMNGITAKWKFQI